MATQTDFTCSECSKTFGNQRGLNTHAARTKHDPAPARIVEEAIVADGAQEEPTSIDAKRAEKEAKAAAKAEAKAAADAEKAAKAEARAAAKAEKDAADAAAKAEREAAKAAKAAEKAKAAEERAAARAAAKAEREAPRTTPCECGCGGIPAGRKSRFLPGHDAKHYSAIRAENGVKDAAPAE